MSDTTSTTDRINYLTGVSNEHVRAIAHEVGIGLLAQPGNRYENQVDEFPRWAADNGAFVKGQTHDRFDAARFADYLDRRLPKLTDDQRARCLFVNAPDAIDVSADGRVVIGHAELTLEWFAVWAPRIKAAGFPVGFVAGNGHELMLDRLPWAEIDVLFLGGGDDWKLGEAGAAVAAEAIRRGIPVHMGRVNSRKRFRYAASIGCSTADGTFLLFARGVEGVARMLRWFPGLPVRPWAPITAAVEVVEEGVACAACSTGRGAARIVRRHRSNAAVRECHELALAGR